MTETVATFKFFKIEKADRTGQHYDVRDIVTGDRLAEINYWPNLKCFIFAPKALTIWSYDCLHNVAGFTETLNRETKRK